MDGSTAVLPPMSVGFVERPDGVKGRLFEFVSKFADEFTCLQGSDIKELTQRAEAVTRAHQAELRTHVDYDAGTAAIKIVNRWNHQQADGSYTIREPDFSYCS